MKQNKTSQEEAEESEVLVHAAGDDEDFVFGAVDLDGCEESAPSSQTAPAPAASAASSMALQHDSLSERLVYEWRERKRRRTIDSPFSS